MEKYKYINSIDFGKASRAWNCQIDFRVKTRRQCTMECHAVTGSGLHLRFGLIGVLSALLSAIKIFRYEYKRLQSLPGSFELN
jgi:hypothetical protein